MIWIYSNQFFTSVFLLFSIETLAVKVSSMLLLVMKLKKQQSDEKISAWQSLQLIYFAQF